MNSINERRIEQGTTRFACDTVISTSDDDASDTESARGVCVCVCVYLRPAASALAAGGETQLSVPSYSRWAAPARMCFPASCIYA